MERESIIFVDEDIDRPHERREALGSFLLAI
jgi:hypothetical protein